MTAVRRNTPAVLLTALAVLLVLTATGRGDAPSELRRLAGPYAQDLVRWELTHALDKWVHLASVILLRRSTDEDDRRAEVTEFFALGDALRGVDAELERTLAAGEADPRAPEAIAADAETLAGRRAEIRAAVEETLEATISEVVDELGIIRRVGRIDFLIAGSILFVAHEIDQVLEQSPAFRVPENGARRFLLEMKQVHDSTQPSVISLLGFPN